MAKQLYKEYRVLDLPTSGLQKGDRYYLNVGANKYQTYIVSDSLQLTKEAGAEFIEKDTMAQMRSLSSREIWALQNGYYKGVKLNGYYTKNDTPSPIEYYLSTNIDTDNGASIIIVEDIKLEHVFVGEVDASYSGAKEEAGYNNSPHINKALELFKNVVISKYYHISADSNTSGVIMQNNSRIKFTETGVLKALPSSSDNYQLIRVYDVENVVIDSAKIIGDRYEHLTKDGITYKEFKNATNFNTGEAVIIDAWGFKVTVGGLSTTKPVLALGAGGKPIFQGTTLEIGNTITTSGLTLQYIGRGGEWGHGIAVVNSINVKIPNANIRDCWGDGLYLGNQYEDPNSVKSTDNVTVDNLIVDNVRRNGASITSNKNVTLNNPKIYNVNGIAPQAGVDIEPEGKDGVPIVIDNININNLYTYNNAGVGLMIFLTEHVKIENNSKIDINIINHIDEKSNQGFSALGSGTIDNLSGDIRVYNPTYNQNKANAVVVENWGTTNAPNLLIDEPKIIDWCQIPQSFDPDSHGIVFRKSGGADKNINVLINKPIFKRKTQSSTIFCIYGFSAVPVPDAVVINEPKQVIYNNKIVPKVKGITIKDTLNVFKGEYWETTQLAQRVYPARFLSTYTNKNINTAGNAIFTIEGSNWNEGERVTFLVENSTSTIIVRTDGSTLIRPTILGGNLGSNIIGDKLVLEFRGGRWFIVTEIGIWRDVKRSDELFIVSTSEPINKAPNMVWVDTTANKIKIRDVGNANWIPLNLDNATTTTKGVVSQSTRISDVGTPDATDLATAITLVNRLSVVVQAMLTTDRASGQRQI